MTKRSHTVDRDLGWKAVQREISKLVKEPYVKVGVLESAGMHTGSGGKVTIADIAIANEFGTDRIPERPFLRTSIKEMEQEVTELTGRLFQGVISGRMTVGRALDLIGQRAVARIRRRLTEGPWTPNSPATIRAKGSARPLVDTGQLRQSISYEKVGA